MQHRQTEFVQYRVTRSIFNVNPDAPIFAELRGIMLKTVGLADILRLAPLPLSDKIQAAFI